jgi:hypothetical protein
MGYGSGTIFRRGKFWYYQCWVNGRQFGPFSSKSTKREIAQRELDKVLGKRARGEITGTRKDVITLGELLDEYLDYADRKLAAVTAYIYRKITDAHLRKPFGSMPASALSVARLKRYRVDRGAAGA